MTTKDCSINLMENKNYNIGIVVLTNDIDKTESGYKPDKLSHMRLEAGAIRYHWLAENDEKPALIISGGKIREGPTLAEIVRNSAVEEFHIPKDDIYLEEESWNTAENAIYSIDFLAKNKISECVIITNQFHLGRALDCFNYYTNGHNIYFHGQSAEDMILIKYPSRKDEIEAFKRKKDTIDRAKQNQIQRHIFNIPILGPFLTRYAVHIQMALLGERPQKHVLDE